MSTIGAVCNHSEAQFQILQNNIERFNIYPVGWMLVTHMAKIAGRYGSFFLSFQLNCNLNFGSMPARILVVDDEKNVQRLFEQRFRRERKKGLIEFDFAFSAEEALSYLERTDTDRLAWVLTDINMPQQNGLELLAQLRLKYKDLPVMMVTAYNDEDRRREAQELGAKGYLTKPIDFKGLKAKILA